MSLTVQQATRADADALITLETTCFNQDRQSPRSLRYLLARACAEVWFVAEETPQAAWLGGMILLMRRRSRILRVYSIAVSPQARGRGIGHSLLRHAETRARAVCCDTLRCEIRRDNTASRALFESGGYVAFARTPDYYEDGMEAIRYQKVVAS